MCTVLAIAMSVAYVHPARFIPLWRISALKVAAAHGKLSFIAFVGYRPFQVILFSKVFDVFLS
jgi:hypothetical protein